MKGYNLPDDVSPSDPNAPWNKEPKMRKITVRVKFQGYKIFELEVPDDFDTSDKDALTDVLDNHTMKNRPVQNAFNPDDWKFTNWNIGEFWGEPWSYNPDAPAIYISEVWED